MKEYILNLIDQDIKFTEADIEQMIGVLTSLQGTKEKNNYFFNKKIKEAKAKLQKITKYREQIENTLK